jgi:hypothetical protein
MNVTANIVMLKILCMKGIETSGEALILTETDIGDDILEQLGDVEEMSNDQLYLAWREIEDTDDFTGWFWNRINNPKKVLREVTKRQKGKV